MPERYLHLPISRLEPVNERRRGGGRGPRAPENPSAHAEALRHALEDAVAASSRAVGGFDPRLLLKLTVVDLEPDALESIPGIQVVSQEGQNLVVLFASEEGRAEFVKRLELLSAGKPVTRRDILFGIHGFAEWGREDRMGRALRTEGPPPTERFVADVELWPLDRGDQRISMIQAFEQWCRTCGIDIIDAVRQQEAVVLFRLRVDRGQMDRLLEHRDVRLVDLPPRYRLEFGLIHTPLEAIPPVEPPPEDAVGVVVLDSGLASNHPLIRPAVGDAQSFVTGRGPAEDDGHGTMVAGLALYGNVETCIRSGRFVPCLWLFSGKVYDGGDVDETLIENRVIEAVRYFRDHYGLRVFNLSFGDVRKPYDGGPVRPLAAVLDMLSKEYGALFVVSAGNFTGADDAPADWRQQYPAYLLLDEARIVDPAPAINALTVGSLARYEVARMAERNPDDPAYQPIARRDEPSPFSRSGPGHRGAIKPEVVEYGGNLHVDTRSNANSPLGRGDLGELTMNYRFASGNLFTVGNGTSFAAPQVAHLAARILAEYRDATPDLLRALIVAHAHHPEASRELLGANQEHLYRLVGYGKPDWDACRFSSERCVTLVSQEVIAENEHHFYEIPLPADFFIPPPRRTGRRLTVALAHTPRVRRTRLAYRLSTVDFRVVAASDLDSVVAVFRRAPRDEREPSIREFGAFRPGWRDRRRGTVQMARWDIAQVDRRWNERRLFVVVTRTVPDWALNIEPEEPYALVIVVEDRSPVPVRYYTQIREMLRARVRLMQSRGA